MNENQIQNCYPSTTGQIECDNKDTECVGGVTMATYQYSENEIPIGAEIVIQHDENKRARHSQHLPFVRNGPNLCDPDYENVLDSLAFDNAVEVQQTDSGIRLDMPSDLSNCIAEEDLDMAVCSGNCRWNRPRALDKCKITPNRKQMRVLLRHIYDVTGQVYEDIPYKFRSSHISLALYLKTCSQYGGSLKNQ